MTAHRSAPWHLPGAALAGYARGDLTSPQTWSVEAHLEACAVCRADLTRLFTQLATAAPPGSDLAIALRLAEASGAAALASKRLPAQGRVRAGSAARRRRVLLLAGGGAGAGTHWPSCSSWGSPPCST